MQRRVTMLRRSSWLAAAVSAALLPLAFVTVSFAQAKPAAQQSSAPAQGPHREGTDNILVDQYGIPLEDQSGKSIPPQQASTGAANAANVDTGDTAAPSANPN